MQRPKRPLVKGVVLTMALALLIPAAGPATEEGGPSEEEMAAFIEATSPGEEHKALEAMVGSWNTKVLMWNAPDQPEPGVSSGSAEMQLILGGRYVEQQYSGTFMGMPFEGRGFTGYDKVAGHYFSVWMDNFSTGIMIDAGTYDAEAKEFRNKGSYNDPMSGQKAETRSVTHIAGPDRFVTEMFGPGPDGNEFKMMEIIYTRK